MPTYTDILIRDNFGDTGVTPSTGVAYASPDLIPFQSGTPEWSQLISTYPSGPDLGLNIVQQGLNNIFIRAKNPLLSTTVTGSARLYYAKSSLLLLPNQWIPVTNPSGQSSMPFFNQSGSTQLSPGDLLLSSPAFVLTNLPITNDHYCFIGAADTQQHPWSKPSSFSSNAAFALWVQNTPAVGWRNITTIPNTLIQSVSSYIFGSQNQAAGYYHFRIMSPSGSNYPANTAVSVQCTDPRSPINQNLTLPAPDQQGNQIIGFDAFMPGGDFTTSLVATVTSPNNQPFPRGAKLGITYFQYPSPVMDKVETKAAHHHTIARVVKNVGPVAHTALLIQLGECWVQIAS